VSEPDGEKLPSGWQQTDLGTVISLSYGKGLPEETRQSGNFPVCGSNGRVGTHSRALIEGPAIIVGRKGTVGAVHFEPGPCWPIDTTYFVNQFPQLHPRFVCYQLIHLRLGQFDKSTAIPGISRTDVYAKSFVLCSLREQERIADALDELFSDLDAGVAALEQARAKLKLYRASVLKAAVEGALTAKWRKQHPQVEPASELLKCILAERHHRWKEDQLAKYQGPGATKVLECEIHRTRRP
jgi:type I restriction enzyme S subunit